MFSQDDGGVRSLDDSRNGDSPRTVHVPLDPAGLAAAQTPAPVPAAARKGKLKQSVMRTNFDPKMPFEDMCKTAADLGFKGFDLVQPNDWPTLKKYGLVKEKTL